MIFEDPDELGYFTEAARPALLVCNEILTMQERADIEAAAINAHEGHKKDAERCRKFAGYDRLGSRRDADNPTERMFRS